MDDPKKCHETQAGIASGRLNSEASHDRREAMKKLGRYAAYTAPAMLALFQAEKAGAAFSGGE